MPIIDLKSELRTLAERIYEGTKSNLEHRNDDANRMLKFFGSAEGAMYAAKQALLSPEDATKRIARALKATQLSRAPFGLGGPQPNLPSEGTAEEISRILDRTSKYQALTKDAKESTPAWSRESLTQDQFLNKTVEGEDYIYKYGDSFDRHRFFDQTVLIRPEEEDRLKNFDTVPFYFTTYNLSNGKVELGQSLPFTSFISSISDSAGGNWNSFSFTGRGELFHVFQTYSRTLSITFKVAAFNQDELGKIHQRLSYLKNLTAPKYTSTGLMQGNIISLTIGDYLKQLPGFLTSVGFTVDENINWETREGEEKLPHVVNVQVQFTVIEKTTPKSLI